MGVAVVVTAIMLMTALVNAETQSPEVDCNPDKCYLVERIEMTWSEAQAHCESVSGNLVQIHSKSEEAAVKATRNKVDSTLDYWIGVSNRDQDCSFEYINGTKLLTHETGLGDWSDERVVTKAYEVSCVYLGKGDDKWLNAPCTDKKVFICEKLKSPMAKIDHGPNPCTDESCPCVAKDWTYYKEENIFIKVNKVAASYEHSASFCAELGGQLLTIHDEAKRNFVKGMQAWSPRGVGYWMGLRKEGYQWTWVDRTKLLVGSKGYQQWFDNPFLEDMCAMAVWDYKAKWRTANCTSKYFHICESPKPCTSAPVISINDVRQENGGSVTVTNAQDVQIKCSVGSRDQFVSKVQIICGHEERLTSRTNSAKMTLRVDVKMNQEKCACQVEMKNKDVEETHFSISFKTRPRLRRRDDNGRTVLAHAGDYMVATFELYANPKPAVHSLIKEGNEVLVDDYSVTITPMSNDLLYSVVVNMGRFDKGKSGTYSILVENGIEDTLKYLFIIHKVDMAERRGVTDDFVLWPLLLVGIATVGMILVVIVAMTMKGVSDESKTPTKDESTSHCEDEYFPGA